MLEGAIITGAGRLLYGWLEHERSVYVGGSINYWSGYYYMAGWNIRGVCMLEGAIITGAGTIIWLAGA